MVHGHEYRSLLAAQDGPDFRRSLDRRDRSGRRNYSILQKGLLLGLLQELSDAPQRKDEKDCSNREQCGELWPYDIKTGAPEQDRLRQDDEVGIRGRQHDGLDDLWHALARRDASRQDLKRQEHKHQQQPELRHRTGDGGEEDPHAGRREELQGSAEHE